MEPMTLGSPVSSPVASASQSQYLPSFLMGETQTTVTPRSNTLSPKGAGRAFGCAITSPGISNAPTEFNRSALAPNTLFGGHQQQKVYNSNKSYSNTPTRNDSHQTGPPTQGLFDSLRQEHNRVQSPANRSSQLLQQHPSQVSYSVSLDQSYSQTPHFNDSYAPTAPNAFNASMRALCSPLGANMTGSPVQRPLGVDFWVTIFGFPPGATSSILQHFTLCGTIVDKVLAPQNGNWMHVRFASRIECDKALNYNEKIVGNNIMIGVTRCTERSIIDKENDSAGFSPIEGNLSNESSRPKVRSLAQQGYKNAQNDTAVAPVKIMPQKGNCIVNKAMDLFFGW